MSVADKYWWQGRSSRRSDMMAGTIIEEMAIHYGLPPEAFRIVRPDGQYHGEGDSLSAIRWEWERECGEYAPPGRQDFWRKWRRARRDEARRAVY